MHFRWNRLIPIMKYDAKGEYWWAAVVINWAIYEKWNSGWMLAVFDSTSSLWMYINIRNSIGEIFHEMLFSSKNLCPKCYYHRSIGFDRTSTISIQFSRISCLSHLFLLRLSLFCLLRFSATLPRDESLVFPFLPFLHFAPLACSNPPFHLVEDTKISRIHTSTVCMQSGGKHELH